ncbi:uncharacterized protein LOC136026356 [Artemia franciscana]|uniref:uncharacterized protein LOC136026356 n=1 Tax=Artemia franciscana TaxID=6661 RepID=UPI0032DB8D58
MATQQRVFMMLIVFAVTLELFPRPAQAIHCRYFKPLIGISCEEIRLEIIRRSRLIDPTDSCASSVWSCLECCLYKILIRTWYRRELEAKRQKALESENQFEIDSLRFH